MNKAQQLSWLEEEVERCHRLIDTKVIETANMEAELRRLVEHDPTLTDIPKPFADYLNRFWIRVETQDFERAMIRLMSTDLSGQTALTIACVARTIRTLTAHYEERSAQ